MSKIEYKRTYIKDFNATPIERKHIILLDGTWNDETGIGADGLVTNIVHMSRIFINDSKKQIVRYHRGVGNDNDNGWISSRWKGANGKAIGSIVERAYARFVQDWQKGDVIYIFGFSRGSAAARLLASKIKDEGIPKSIEITLKPKENKESKVVEQVISDIEIEKSGEHNVDIEFLGVWDTVSALGFVNIVLRFIGVKKNDLFTDDNIAGNIKKAVHLVAIDETRNPFIPSLMNYKKGITHEVWFPGVHSDVGGSYLEDEIAKVTLFYMIKQMTLWNKEQKLQDFLIHEGYYQEYTRAEIEKAYFHFHGNAVGESLRTIGVQVNGVITDLKVNKPKIHKLYREIASNKNSYSVIKKHNKEREDETKLINFQYMPFNVKVLNKQYEIVS